MKQITQDYLIRLKEKYAEYNDQDSLNALAEAESLEERARTLSIYREQDKTQELISAALERYRECLHKLSDPKEAMKMNDADRAFCFAAMDWAMYTLDIVGETPENASAQVDEIVKGYAIKAGIIHS